MLCKFITICAFEMPVHISINEHDKAKLLLDGHLIVSNFIVDLHVVATLSLISF